MMKLVLCLALLVVVASAQSTYKFGVGSYDITGPAAEVGMMGYAMTDQTSYGIHLRLRARAFIYSDGIKTITFVNLDACMGTQAVKNVTMQKLNKLFPGVFTEETVMLSGTHTHAGPGGYDWHPMYLISTLGFQSDNFAAITNGIVKAIANAYSMMQAGTQTNIYQNSGILLNSNINRSPSAYQANPEAEKAKYQYDTDKEMFLLKMQTPAGKGIAALNWFPVHGTSMNNKNGFISGDNKGYAEYAFERYMNGNNTVTGRGTFISAFAQTNSGDVSPNTRGAFCKNGSPCEVAHSTCGGFSEDCLGYGPGKDEFESTQIIGNNQFQQALRLYNTATAPVTGRIRSIFTYVNMETVQVQPKYSGLPNTVSTCMSALGDAFAAGTTDGPGEFNFVQGTNSTSTNPYWNFIGQILAKPTQTDVNCQYPKPILLFTGGLKFPAEWTQGILPLQVFQLGNVFILGAPAEYSTMAGRRLRDSVSQALAAVGVTNATVVLAALSNAYSHYVTTPQEFSIQRYEGASCLFGPNALPAYQQLFSDLVQRLVLGKPVDPYPYPPDIRNSTFALLPGVLLDEGSFGTVRTQPQASYKIGSQVQVVFISANPRNNFRDGLTFLEVQKKVGNDWQTVFNDADWCTRYRWARDGIAGSTATIQWFIPPETQPGTYRIVHYGDAKDLFGTITPFTGASNSFTVTQ